MAGLVTMTEVKGVTLVLKWATGMVREAAGMVREAAGMVKTASTTALGCVSESASVRGSEMERARASGPCVTTVSAQQASC